MGRARVLVAGLVVTLVVLALAVVVRSIGRSPEPTRPGTIDALATSTDACVTCHRKSSPGIVEQYGHSTMAAAGVHCQDCHEVKSDYPGAVAHEGTFVLAEPSTAMCARCHQNEVAQFTQSRHGLPAYVAYAGSKDLSPAQLAEYSSIPEGQFAPDHCTCCSISGRAGSWSPSACSGVRRSWPRCCSATWVSSAWSRSCPSASTPGDAGSTLAASTRREVCRIVDVTFDDTSESSGGMTA
jgi:hypothetical protein